MKRSTEQTPFPIVHRPRRLGVWRSVLALLPVKDRSSSSTLRGCVRGSACLELAITLPVLVTIFVSVIDIGRAATDYLTINRILYEATRYAASCGSLEEGTFAGVTEIPKGHQAIRERVRNLLDRYGIDSQSLEQITTELQETSENYLEVRVSLHLPFRPLFLRFAFMDQLGGEATGPYLFKNAKTETEV